MAAAGALGAATPVNPPPGAVVRITVPTFTWVLPANEQASAIYVATRPRTDSSGKLLDENIIDGDILSDARATSWRAADPYYNGTYWWSVRTFNPKSYTESYSPPARFTIPAYLRVVSIRTHPVHTRHTLVIQIRRRANVRTVSTRAELRLGKRLVWWRNVRESYSEPGAVVPVRLIAKLSSTVPRGTKLALRTRVRGAGFVARSQQFVRAP